VVGIVVTIAVTGVGPAGPTVTETVKAFLVDWESGDYPAAATMTTGAPGVVTQMLRAAYSQLGAADLVLSMGAISVHGASAEAFFYASVNLGRDGLPWQYRGHFALRRSGPGWRVVWAPSVIAPGLAPGDRLAVLTTVPPRSELLDSAGRPLLRRSDAFNVGVVPDKLANSSLTAQDLALVTGIDTDADQMEDQILAAPSNSFLELVRLNPARYQGLSKALATVPGLVIRPVTTRLFESVVPAITGQIGTETAKVLVEDGAPYQPGTTVGLSGLEQTYQAKLAGSPTTEVVVQNAAGRQVAVLGRWPGHVGTAVQTTIDGGVQAAAQHALAGSPFSASIVAVSADSGQILAVAGHKVAGSPVVSPLAGQYQPGQSFMIVSAAALLKSSPGFGANTPIRCYPTNLGITNVPREPSLGPQPTFSVDFAHACSTAFAGLSLRLSPADLQNAAATFGIGAHWQLRLPAFTGSMVRPASSRQQAADVVGRGTVQVSPLDMALAAGLVESGSWHPPTLSTAPPASAAARALAPADTLSSRVVVQLRHLMGMTVRSGAGQAAHLPGAAVFGAVGTAPLAGHHDLHAIWFVGFRGNVAFAVLIFSRSTAFGPVAQLARQFAVALPASS
jgi:cell division protein FtsI/penicillin-binding protein 2